MASPPRSSTEDRVYLERYSADRSSIFIGALPSDVTEDQLRQIFEPFGPINEVLIRVTPSRYDPEENVCFAFIEFRSWESVTKVLSVKVCRYLLTPNSTPCFCQYILLTSRAAQLRNEWQANSRFTEGCSCSSSS